MTSKTPANVTFKKSKATNQMVYFSVGRVHEIQYKYNLQHDSHEV